MSDWVIIHDDVMGGRSKAEMDRNGRFRGVLCVVCGGFAMVRRHVPIVHRSKVSEGIEIEVQSPQPTSGEYRVLLYTDQGFEENVAYSAAFSPTLSCGTIRLPYAQFVSVDKHQIRTSMTRGAQKMVFAIGIMACSTIGGNRCQDFELMVRAIRTY